MNTNLKRSLEQLIPFIMLGIGIALAISLLLMFSYLVVWGIIIGGIIWLAVVIKNFFFPRKTLSSNKKGRIIEHDDKD